MNPKAIGLLVGGGLIVSALGVYLIGNIKITPKQKVPQQQVQQVEVQTTAIQQAVQQNNNNTPVQQNNNSPVQQQGGNTPVQQQGQPLQQGGQVVQQPVITNAQQNQQPVQETPPPQQEQPIQQSNQGGGNNGGNSSSGTHDVNLKLITAEGKLDYNSVEQTTTGEVNSKKCYLLNAQIVYCVEIAIAMGTDVKAVEYFCMHDAYAKLRVGDKVTVKYQQTTANTFSVSSVSLQQ